ncbi:DUF420 domain-containing protein [Opitutus sp. ER46]|uniref:DUF420 domain-containing protein n=1 Tax=Opitutus sp. ER46 TaxID=2161864 RepID=UPI000D302520|nr:DUF420 domain-containing protein [Opitutus sp. ER46]PTX96379.1 DUF420 domain-containing protein [Opitutus sp. ER46]
MTVTDIPALNATFNGIATVLMTIGFVFIKRAQRTTDPARRAALILVHRRLMIGTLVASALFLVGYLTYHGMRRGVHTPFGETGALRTLYLAILWTHIPLAALIAFLVPRTLLLAIRGQYDRHRAWARWTYPIWYYVSVTGVLVYLFLYVWWPAKP